jgi:hypothetical protein
MLRFTNCSIVLDHSLTSALAPRLPRDENVSDAAPRGAEFIATVEAELTADGASSLPLPAANYSPGSQVSAPNGELIGPTGGGEKDRAGTKVRPQVICMEPVATEPVASSLTPAAAENARLIHHEAAEPGEVFAVGQSTALSHVPTPTPAAARAAGAGRGCQRRAHSSGQSAARRGPGPRW